MPFLPSPQLPIIQLERHDTSNLKADSSSDSAMKQAPSYLTSRGFETVTLLPSIA